MLILRIIPIAMYFLLGDMSDIYLFFFFFFLGLRLQHMEGPGLQWIRAAAMTYAPASCNPLCEARDQTRTLTVTTLGS